VTVGVVGQAGLRPGTVKVVGRRSIVLVQPPGGGVDGLLHVMGGAHGGGMKIVEVQHVGQGGSDGETTSCDSALA